MFSQQFVPLEKSHSEWPLKEEVMDDNMTPSELVLTKSMSVKSASKKDHNFKVIVRVRPPLPREIEGTLEFTPITQISNNNK